MDTRASEPKDLIELKARKNVKIAAVPAPPQGMESSRYDAASRLAAALSEAQSSRSNNDVAGVLTSVDEDEEAVEEAECPREFDYYSDEDEDGDAMES